MQVIAPGVIDALEILHAATVVQADQRAAMRTAVFERGEFAVFRAHHDHRHGADKRGAVVADIRELGFQAEIVPDRTLEDPLLLQCEHIGVLINPIRNAGEAIGPATANDCIHYRAPSLFVQCNRGSGTLAATRTSTEVAPAASNAFAQALPVAPEVITSSISSTR